MNFEMARRVEATTAIRGGAPTPHSYPVKALSTCFIGVLSFYVNHAKSRETTPLFLCTIGFSVEN